ncbi:MAG: DUF3551 domain-containing protein [Bradyrhizobiaceae bacterium]|nr:MAG: DUF3551 domain-containing protein [Bradyrhizobiaceae bacterium]
MRVAAYLLLFLSLAFVAAMGSAQARDYPYCMRGRTVGLGNDCRFTSLQQCRTSASGLGASCVVNPRVAFRRRQSSHQ